MLRGVEPWLEQLILTATGATAAASSETLQSLWSGYGEIRRVRLVGEVASVILKRVSPPELRRAPAPDQRSHARKLRSYVVEMTWYQQFAGRLGPECRVPQALACHEQGKQRIFVLEDLDAAGYSARRHFLDARLDSQSTEGCLSWLACLHATFLGMAPEGLWSTGTYWHLDTRPDEFGRMSDQRLRNAAAALDRRLREAKFVSFVHGDAKIENFCFPAERPGTNGVAAVDFQYVGGGVGIRDIAYFFSSIWGPSECEAHAQDALDYYFARLRAALDLRLTPLALQALEQEWRALYPVAWADFYRFLDGWAPGHAENHAYSERMVHQALQQL